MKLDHLQRKRLEAQESRERDRLRSLYGAKLVSAIAAATQQPLSLEDFDRESDEPLKVHWPADIRDATGLVAAYIGRDEAWRLLQCFQNKLGLLSGVVGFHDKSYLGRAVLQGVSPTSLLVAAESAEDSLIFYSESPLGALMVDCYASQPGGRFSIVVQGDGLVQKVGSCFTGQ